MRRAFRTSRTLAAAALVAALAAIQLSVPASAAPVSAEPAAATSQASTTTVRYGPFTIPGAADGEPGMLENELDLWTDKPCQGCYVTEIKPNLVYPDGSKANVNTGAMLHHIVLASQFDTDATCEGDWLGLVGERFFASGNERTTVALPPGYGYRVDWWDQWNLIYDLMNMTPNDKTVYVELEYTYTRSAKQVRPVWLDIDQCGDSKYSIPAGHSDDHWDWTVNRPGDIVAIGGHVHDRGVRIEATNENTGESICDSVASYGDTPDYIDMNGNARLSNMTRCIADPVATVSEGQTVRLHSIYDSHEPHDDVMGIMIAYVG